MQRASRWKLYRNYLFLVPLFLAVLSYQAAHVQAVLHWFHSGGETVEPFTTARNRVETVRLEAARAGLKTGDSIATVDGIPFTRYPVLENALRWSRPGQSLIVATPGRRLSIPLVFTPSSGPDFWQDLIQSVLTLMLLGCVAVGIYVAAALPYDSRALIVFGLMVSTAQVISLDWHQYAPRLWAFAAIYQMLVMPFWGVWLVLFALYFPHPFAWDRRRPVLKSLLIVPAAGFSLLVTVSQIGGFFSFETFRWLPEMDGKILATCCITFFFAALSVKSATTPEADAKRRLRILAFGAGLGLTPVGLFIVYDSLYPGTLQSGASAVLVVAIALMFSLFPMTLAYVVLAERALNLRAAVRQSVRYALAKGGLRLLIGCVIAAAAVGFSNVTFGSKFDPNVRIGIFIAFMIVAARVFQNMRQRIQNWVDRRFFREAYNAERVLEELSETVLGMVQRDELLGTVGRRISQTLHVPRITVLLEDGGMFRPAYSLGGESAAEPMFEADSKTIRLIVESQEPQRVYFDRPDHWVHQVPEQELITLRNLHAQLLLPVGARRKLLGVLSLGPKLSEEPYSSSDINLLRSLMTQTGLALENGRLTTAVAVEMAQRESLNREIEIAREVQERLFPQQMPLIAGIDYSGACRPALGVGGDYYDFLPLANGELGIAIGDVSGKGIAAALLMASLQASLRGQAMVNQGDLARLMTNVNQLVYDATPVNRYATFFYGQYNRETHVFTYVNAGHNAPMVLRRVPDGTVHVIRLETGGPVVGLLPLAPYQQGTLVLQPGDIFVGFTDGISEAMNKDDEEWGEERFIPAIASVSGESAQAMIPHLMQSADQFASGAPQHDDMTIVVMKMNAAV